MADPDTPDFVNVTVKVPPTVYRRFSAWCRLHGLRIQDVIADFMREKGGHMTPVEDPNILFHRAPPPEDEKPK